MDRFRGKVAVVTGGGIFGEIEGVGLGVGATICEVLAAEGCTVAVLDRDVKHAEETVRRIEDQGGSALAVRADVTSGDDCREAINEVMAALGQIDVLANCVGIDKGTEKHEQENDRTLTNLPPVTAVEEADWDRIMSVNVKGMMLMSKHAGPHLGDRASIVTIASTGALRPRKGTSAYATSKGAVISLTYALAVDMAPIRANCVSPGRVLTPIALRVMAPRLGKDGALSDRQMIEEIRSDQAQDTLLKRGGTAEDIAKAVAFLASDDARWITGQHLIVDGGKSLLGH